jgi:hypothetical protein
MRRKVLALAAGAVVGGGLVLAVRMISDRYAAEGDLPTPLAAAREELTSFVRDVRGGMREREGELRAALGLDGAPEGSRLDPRQTLDLLDDPAGWRAPKG